MMIARLIKYYKYFSQFFFFIVVLTYVLIFNSISLIQFANNDDVLSRILIVLMIKLFAVNLSLVKDFVILLIKGGLYAFLCI